jgi:hypothetical protein
MYFDADGFFFFSAMELVLGSCWDYFLMLNKTLVDHGISDAHII